MRTKYLIDVTPDRHLNPGAAVVMTHTVDDESLEDLVTFSPDPEYFFTVDGKEYTPEHFRRIVRRAAKLEALEDYGKRHLPGWTFVVGGKAL